MHRRGIGDTVRSHFTWGIDLDGDPGLHTGPDDNRRFVENAFHQLLKRCRQRRHHARNDGAGDVLPQKSFVLEERLQQNVVLIREMVKVRGHPPVSDPLAVVMHPDCRFGVPDIQHQQHNRILHPAGG